MKNFVVGYTDENGKYVQRIWKAKDRESIIKDAKKRGYRVKVIHG